MTITLPATFIEAEAIEEVGRWIAVVQDMMTAEASGPWLERTLREFMQQGLIETLTVTRAAREGDQIADTACRQVFHETLDRGEMPGAALRAYIAERDLLGPARRRAGRNTLFDHWRRDIGIAVLVFLVCKRFNLRPTRSPESRTKLRPSGCSVLAPALGKARINVSEGRLQNIWALLGGQVTAFAEKIHVNS